ncbi:MAG: helix-turn-helix domain-containing protein [Lentisphaerae bacterium]|nr:helix-turn-helix domain-containing protein [Lentisphaerota bacterium]MCP4102027.1 helix-turn-helix domain-containing protein [Lentisphaerota bacterium]
MTKKTKTAGPEWYTVKQAAEYLQVGEPTIYRWMRDNKITFRKIGDATRFLREDLNAVVQVHHSKNDSENARKICPVCHSEDLHAGRIRSTGLIYFQLKRLNFWTVKNSMVKTESMMCANCGAVTMFGDRSKLEKIIEQPRLDTVEPVNSPKNKT